MSNYDSAVSALKTARTVAEWNEIRAQYVPLLTSIELHSIDAKGLIVQVLGRDAPSYAYINKVTEEQ